MENLNTITFFCSLFIMLMVECLCPNRTWEEPRLKRLGIHFLLSVLNSIILFLVTIIPFVYWKKSLLGKSWGISSALGLEGILEILLSIVILDMFNYWWHRINHEIPFFWRFHKVHHSDTQVDVTTTLRFHPGELLLSDLFIKVIWIVTWGPSLAAFIIFESCITLCAMFHHSNIDFPDKCERILQRVIVTPRFHMSHHTVDKLTGDANYSTIFSIWDKLFGTFHQPDTGLGKPLGLEKGREAHLSFKEILIGPFHNDY